MDLLSKLQSQLSRQFSWCLDHVTFDNLFPDRRSTLVFLVALLGSGYVLRVYGRRGKRRAPLPPGPATYPLLGNIDIYGHNEALYSSFHELSQIHGPVMSTYLPLGWPLVVLSGADAIRGAFVDNSDCFSNRPQFIPTDKFIGLKGIVRVNPGDSKVLRKFTLKALRDLGMGKQSFQDKLDAEISYLCNDLTSLNGSPFLPEHFISQAIFNIICTFIFGARFEYDNPTFKRMMFIMNEFKEKGGYRNVAFYIVPVFVMRIIARGEFAYMMGLFDDLRDMVKQHIVQHEKEFDIEHVEDFIDMYYKHLHFDPEAKIDDENLVGAIIDLIIGGTETTTTSIHWCLYFLAAYPDIQEKCRQEYIQVKGSSNQPTYADKADLPYFEAFLNEAFRLGCIAPLGLMHCTAYDIEFQGYFIAKDTIVMANFYSGHVDPKAFIHPLTFAPERWLPADSTTKPSDFLPFSCGPRVCMGESIARQEVFTFIACLLQKFSFRFPDGVTPEIAPSQGITRSPGNWKIIADILD